MSPLIPDRYDWRGCDAVRFNPEKMGGTATVGEVRLSADSVYEIFLTGDSVEEISDTFETDLEMIRGVISYAVAHDLQPRSRPLLILGLARLGDERFVFKLTPCPNGIRLDMRRSDRTMSKETGAGIWPDVEKAMSIAQATVDRLLAPGLPVAWTDYSD